MRDWLFKLNDRTLKHDIAEWREFGISFGRESKTSLIKSYTSQFTFIKEDAEWLKNIVYTQGCNAVVTVKIYSVDAFGNSTLEYEAQLNLSTFVDKGSKVSAGVYEGGFFNLLDNNWETEFEIKEDIFGADLSSNVGQVEVIEGEEIELPFNWPNSALTMPTGMNNFEDIKFTGGEYLYNEDLGLNDNAEYTVTTGGQIDNFLPIKKKGIGNDLLKYFIDASQMAVLSNAEQVTKQQCFINSPDKINGGYIEIKGRNSCTFIFNDINNSLDISDGFLNKIKKCRLIFRIKAFLFNEVLGDDVWRPSQNLLSGAPLEMVIDYTYPCRFEFYIYNNLVNCKAIVENVHLQTGYGVGGTIERSVLLPHYDKYTAGTFNNFFYIDGYLNQYKSTGYFLAISISDIVAYFQSDSELRRYAGQKQIVIKPNSNFKVLYKNPNFKLNVNRTVYGMRPSEVVHKILTKINNHKYTLNINLDELKSKIENEADVSLMLCSGQGLRGSKYMAWDNASPIILKTSIEKLTDFLYKSFGLKMIAVYSDGIYNISFTKVENTFKSNTQMAKLDNVTIPNIKPYDKVLYTDVHVGWANDEAIFGQYEFNTKNVFKTGNDTLKNNILNLISEYKGGCMDVETYVHANYNNYQDSKQGDNQIFVLSVYQGSVLRTNINTYSIKKAINTRLTPKRILHDHNQELASYFYFNNVLKFHSSERNADFTRNNSEYENTDFVCTNPLFIPFVFEVESPATYKLLKQIYSNPYGYISFNIDDVRYNGYLAEDVEAVKVNVMKEKQNTFKLLKKV